MKTLLLASLLILGDSIGVPTEDLSFDAQALSKLPQSKLEVVVKGKTIVYTGVPLAVVLEKAVEGKPGMQAVRSLSSRALVVRAKDDYQVAFSAAAVAMDKEGKRYFIALAENGSPLADDHAPAQIVVANETETRARWVHGVDSIHLLTIPKLKTEKK